MQPRAFLLSLALIVLAPRIAAAQEPEPETPPTPVEAPPPVVERAPTDVTAAAPEPARPSAPARRGFTIELGIGASFMALGNAPAQAATDHVGLAPLSLGIGGFLSREVSLTFRMSGVSSFRDRGLGVEQTVLGFYGPSLQYFVSDDVFVSAGIGLGLLALNPLLSRSEKRGGVEVSRESMDPRFGFAGNARVGWNFVKTKGVGLMAYAETTPAKLEDVTAFGASIGLGFQTY